MVKPRVFVSSTYYDLKHIRNSLKSFIDSFGYETALFEDGDIPYDHLLTIDQSCYSEVTKCHMLVLIIGGRYGSISSATESTERCDNCNTNESITVKEYKSARDKDIPIFIFIERNVYTEYRTYKANAGNSEVNYAYVDNIKVFEFIDQIFTQKRNNQVCEFDKFEDISNWLRDQWAGLFAEYLRQRQEQRTLLSISAKIDELSQVSDALRTYTESLMKEVKPEGFDDIIKTESKKIEDASKKKFFFDHYFPVHIMDLANRYNLKPSETEIYSAFIQTDYFNDFLAKLGFSSEEIKNITLICWHNDLYMDLKNAFKNEFGT